MQSQLNTRNHDRDATGMTYLYPVISRRAGGVSIGINLNPNNACNWHCAYCQVPDLTRGSAPEIDLALLEQEFHTLVDDLLNGDFMERRVPEGSRRLCDVAISGNGEPTSCANFEVIVALILRLMQHYDLTLPLRLITNGSYMRKAHVQQGLKLMAEHHGEVWIKVDGVSDEAIQRINGVSLDRQQLKQQVLLAASCAPSWIQSCMFSWNGAPPTDNDVDTYLDFLAELKDEASDLRGVLLYGLARPSLQPEADMLAPLDTVWMQQLAKRIEQIGLPVNLSL